MEATDACPQFELVSEYDPQGDQPKAIAELTEGVKDGLRTQTLLGGTGTGKTYTIAQTIQNAQRPTLVISHNKTLAAQLCNEFRQFFPNNAVQYFVSYYDYYQPEAYIPHQDLYIEKDASINDEIDRLRHAATSALLERRDVIIVASVSCIYGLGAPVDYQSMTLTLETGDVRDRDDVLRRLVELQYERNDVGFYRGTFRVRGDTIELIPAYHEDALRIEFFGDEIESITERDAITGNKIRDRQRVTVYPASHFIVPEDRMEKALVGIERELDEQLDRLKAENKLVEAQRLEQRTKYDLEMMQELGYCSGIENYSRHLAGRQAGSRPYTLLDYFPDDFLMVVDESHVTLPQIRGMYNGDRARKATLINYGFRLPSAADNRPLTFEEFEPMINQAIFMSATPGPYEYAHSDQIVEQIVRPTGLVDPTIDVRPVEGQIDDLLEEIRTVVERGERVLVTTLTKKMAEDLTDYLVDIDVNARYLHSEIEALERIDILRDLRLGEFDVLVGINLLREGLDLPEVSLVAILDADKEGFLRSETSLIQTIGRAARNVQGRVILYADHVTGSMQRAIDETERRRKIQLAFNETHGITPETIKKSIQEFMPELRREERQASATSASSTDDPEALSPDELAEQIKELEEQMYTAAKNLEFERAAELRDEIQELRGLLTGVAT